MSMAYKFLFGEGEIVIHESWSPLFILMEDELKNISRQIGEARQYTPARENIFKVFERPLDSIKVILLGQDPYPQENVATGRAFEPANYENWNTTTQNTSIINILKELYIEHFGLPRTNIQIVRNAILDRTFRILPPTRIFTHWELNGVLLLNTSLTCELESPNSHNIFWRCFTKKTIEYIAENNIEKHWLLFGDEAKAFVPLIKYSGSKNILKLKTHPKNAEFVGSRAFEGVMEFVI